jgi:hypothetical protein
LAPFVYLCLKEDNLGIALPMAASNVGGWLGAKLAITKKRLYPNIFSGSCCNLSSVLRCILQLKSVFGSN